MDKCHLQMEIKLHPSRTSRVIVFMDTFEIYFYDLISMIFIDQISKDLKLYIKLLRRRKGYC